MRTKSTLLGATPAVALAAAALAALAAPAPAHAEPFVLRPLTLPRSSVELGAGLGLGHVSTPGPDPTGVGLDLEVAYGITAFVELRLRTGIRFGDDGRATRADQYGRMFDTETYGTGHDDLANPEISLRWSLLHGPTLELGLDGRVYLPIEDGTRFGFMLALPLALHLGGTARIDTGLYVPVIWERNEGTDALVSVPLHLWFQVTPRLYLGPLTGVRSVRGDTQVPFGFGLGVGLSYEVDLRTWLLFPDVSGDGSARTFGAGVGIDARF